MKVNHSTTSANGRKKIPARLIIGWSIVSVPIILVFLYVFSNTYSVIRPPRVSNGNLNLSHWNFEENGSVKLDGKWLVYWDQLVAPEELALTSSKTTTFSVPAIWNNTIINGKNVAVKELRLFTRIFFFPKVKSYTR